MLKYPPATEVREVIAESLHAALLNVMQPSVTHIGPINTIGCFLLKYLTGCDYVPMAGSVEVRCASVPFGIQAHIENIDIHAYYVWIECDRGDEGVELVDFGSRYWKAWAADEGVIWAAATPPAFVWDWKAETSCWADYHTHGEISTAVLRAIEDAIAAHQPDRSVDRWEAAINDAIDRMLDSEIGLKFLLDAGIAKPVEEDEPFQ